MANKNTILVIFIFLISFGPAFPDAGDAGEVMFDFEVDARGLFVNDQRIQWSGMEATFGVEGALRARISKKSGNTQFFAFSELEFDQKFDDNMLVDEYRENYIQHFEIDRFRVTRLFVGVKFKHVEIILGKKTTPFGSDELTHFSNSRFMNPFIRTDAVLWRETGLFLGYRNGVVRLDLAVVNGGPEKDTNSSKAAIARAGIELPDLSFGISVKMQDGIGSEWQKQYKNHIGVDLTARAGQFTIYAEGIYDEYGFRKEFDSDDIFWERSLYYRDRFYQFETPITGMGGYLGIRYSRPRLLLDINYGEFHPEEIGDPYHDTPIKRGILKFTYNFTREFSLFAGALLENNRPREPVFSGASGYAYTAGFRFSVQ